MKRRSLLFISLSLIVVFTSIQCSLVSKIINPNSAPVPPLNVNPDQQGNPGQQNQFKLTGIWESQTDTGFGTTMYAELILEPTGTFSQQVTVADLMTLDTGSYAVGDSFIRFVVTNHEPKEYKGQPMNWLTSFTYYYSVVDANTVIFEDRVAGSQWYAYRQTTP
jgi:hypothetical protein